MFHNMTPLLTDAATKTQAVGSFNVYSYETIRGVLEAGAEAKAPVILAFGERYLSNMSFETVAAITTEVASELDVEFALHLDHCKSMDHVFQAINAGFSSVMYDGSALSFEQNLANTAAVCKVAHALGVTVEAELGSLASGENSQESEDNDSQVYTDPAQAARFVSESGTDALAVSIGTVHGDYKGEPNIRVDILKKINAAVDAPLVLHGGSGTPEDIVRECIRNGIRKINVNTEISTYSAAKLREYLAAKESAHLSNVSLAIIDYVKEAVTKYIDLFRSA